MLPNQIHEIKLLKNLFKMFEVISIYLFIFLPTSIFVRPFLFFKTAFLPFLPRFNNVQCKYEK
jgi:hypothetical protein